jgi:hypothetical protein
MSLGGCMDDGIGSRKAMEKLWSKCRSYIVKDEFNPGIVSELLKACEIPGISEPVNGRNLPICVLDKVFY